jgi:hypothetical protein
MSAIGKRPCIIRATPRNEAPTHPRGGHQKSELGLPSPPRDEGATGGGSFPNPGHWKTQANWRGSKMLTQIRIYTINKGEMDNFLKHFKEEIMPLHEKIGVPIVGTWVNRPQNEFIWVRTYKDKAELEAKTKELQAVVAAAGVKLGGNVAKMEVREVESAFA